MGYTAGVRDLGGRATVCTNSYEGRVEGGRENREPWFEHTVTVGIQGQATAPSVITHLALNPPSHNTQQEPGAE